MSVYDKMMGLRGMLGLDDEYDPNDVGASGQRQQDMADTVRAGDHLIRDYYRYRIATDVADRGMDYLTGKDDLDKLGKENEELDVMLKRRQLGLPDDDQQYEMMDNSSRPFRNRGLGAFFTQQLGSMMPDPGFLSSEGAISHGLPYAIGVGGGQMAISELEKLSSRLPYRLSTGVSQDVRPFRNLARLFHR